MSEPERRTDLAEAVFGAVLDHVRQDRFPSTQQLAMLERDFGGRGRAEFVDALLEKVRAERYPSPEMLRRLIRLSR
jgi:hypothetical protein